MKSFNNCWLDDYLPAGHTERSTCGHHRENTGSGHKMQEFLAMHWDGYLSRNKVPLGKLKIMNSIKACKSGELGYTITRCKSCGNTTMHACGCGNRNCPSCGYLNEQKWISQRQSEIIPGIPYYHMVYTLPHELLEIMYKNQKETLNLLFSSVKDTILTLSLDRLGMIPGIVMVLHTFGADLSLHYHLHVLVSGGGLSPDKTQFIHCRDDKYFLPVKMVKDVYKGKFMDGLKGLRAAGRLEYTGCAEKYRNSYVFHELLESCYAHEWNVDVRRLAPASYEKEHISSDDGSTDNVIGYFARYTNRTAISNSRILHYDDKSIRFRYKSYDGSSYTMEEMELSPDEFIRRYLMHLLPSGFTRIRFAGFLACCIKNRNLALINCLLGYEYRKSPVHSMKASELILYFYGRDIYLCDKCNCQLEIYLRVNKAALSYFIRDS